MTFVGTSVTEFFECFPDEDACLRHIFETKFGDHSPCPHCGTTGGWSRISETKKFLHRCRRHISVLKATPFYRSNLCLMAWFYAMLLFCNSSTGMRSAFLRRQLGIGVKSAHRMCNMIRTHMACFEPDRRLGGPNKLVHIDEAFLKYMESGIRQRPHIILGMACEKEVRCGLIADRSLESIIVPINRIVRPGSIIVTDCNLAYSSLAADGWEHITINHAKAFHDYAGMTNNPIEVFWSVLKRTMRLYHPVAPYNLWAFLAEIQFRYNRRFATRSPFFELIEAFPPLDRERLSSLERIFDWSVPLVPENSY